MAGTLEKFFVSIGVKGQDVVLKNIDKIKKEANNISKLKPMLNMGQGNIGKVLGTLKATAGLFKNNGVVPKNPMAQPPNAPEGPAVKKEKENIGTFGKGVQSFGNAIKGFANSASSFDPLTVVKAATTGIGESLSGISILGNTFGNLPKGIAEVTNALVDMASGALKMAKESAAGAYNLKTRNATTAYYENRKYNGSTFEGESLNKDGMSRSENSQLVMEIAGAYGRIQKPMMTVLNQLVQDKDTASLGRVASGNWQSTGTDKGWMLQQISNQTQGLPPSIAQAIQSSLLKSNSDLIQEKTADQKSAQSTNAGFVDRAEDQIESIFKKTSGDSTFQVMDNDLNKMQLALIDIGVGFASSIGTAEAALKSLPDQIKKVNDALDYFKNKLPDTLGQYLPRGISK